METVKRMVLSQWAPLDTCMSALCSVLVIRMNWLAARMPHQLQDIELGQVLANRTGTGNLTPGKDRIPGSRNTAASATKESSQHKI